MCFLKYTISLLLLFQSVFLFSQEDGGKRLRNHRKNPYVKTRIGISPVLGLYKANKNHTTGTKPKMAYNFSIKEEIRFDKHNQNFIMVGAEYMFHGVNFNSYYFYSDSLQLYTPDRLRYKYSITMHELDFPIQLKHSFQNETNSIFSGYIYAGYCYRWIIESHLKVTEDGNELVNQHEPLKFKIPAFGTANSSFLSVGGGFQKNTTLKHNAVYAELQFRYGLSPFYFNESFAPSSMYTTGHFILLTVGFKI
ncbi:MAG: outer membrane beta-barrel protein [Bacteroidetes bacterium]|nr:outer membrane beta-barrel protein [Bacteroidota bacterium]